MLSPEFKYFCQDWFLKADQYRGDSLHNAYDKFFTLFVVYNRLYAECAFELARQGRIRLKSPYSLPDKKAATEYVREYLTPAVLLGRLQSSHTAADALANLKQTLQSGQFHIILRGPSGEPQPNEDRRLLAELQSGDAAQQVDAILRCVYAVRCNLFHGHKSFEQVQLNLLQPLSIILKEIAQILFDKLAAERAA